jgi:hypothetical protein
MLYPLSYEGAKDQSSDLHVHPGWRGVTRVDPPCPGQSRRPATTRRPHGARQLILTFGFR